MSIIEYQNNNISGKNLSAAGAALLLISSSNLSYTDEFFTDNGFPSAYIQVSQPLDFGLEENGINIYATSENPAQLGEIDEEIIINLRMQPLKSYKRNVKVVKKVHAVPSINIPELV